MEIDIRKLSGRPQGANVKTMTTQAIFNPSGWVAVKSKSFGYAFNRVRKGSKTLGPNWYIGFSPTFTKSLSKARTYGVKIPSKGWTRRTIKHYNLTNINDYLPTLQVDIYGPLKYK